MNENIRHAMRSDWEKEAYNNGVNGGISQKEAQLRGLKFGWDNIFASAMEGHLSDFNPNSKGIELFGVGLHALQDGYGHAGVSMSEHSLFRDVYGNMESSQVITDSAIQVHKLISGDWSNLGQNIRINMVGMSQSQKELIWNRVADVFHF